MFIFIIYLYVSALHSACLSVSVSVSFFGLSPCSRASLPIGLNMNVCVIGDVSANAPVTDSVSLSACVFVCMRLRLSVCMSIWPSVLQICVSSSLRLVSISVQMCHLVGIEHTH